MTETNCATGGVIHSTNERLTRRRIAGMALICLLATLLVGWIKARTWHRVEQLKHEFTAIESERFTLGLYLREAVVGMNNALLLYQLSGATTERDTFRRIALEVTKRIGRVRGQLQTAEEAKILAEFTQAYDRYLVEAEVLLERAIRGVRRDSAEQAQEAIAQKSGQLMRTAEALVKAQALALKDFFTGSRAALNSLQRLHWLSLGFLLALVASLALLMFRVWISPLRLQLNDSAVRIARQEKLAALGVLAAGVAHEIRNPLTAVKLRLFSLKKTLDAEGLENEDLGIIHQEINRLERIVKDFLQFARPSPSEMVPTPARNVLEDVSRLMRGELEKRGIQIQVDAADPLMVRIDRQQIQQVLINLVQNAAESIKETGSITLRARAGAANLSQRPEPVAIIEISDTGKGISPEAQPRIFDPFFTTKENGTGLGLAIAARILQSHGGIIQYSTQVNRGTTFSLLLPRLSQE